jgi:hypothetical protein
MMQTYLATSIVTILNWWNLLSLKEQQDLLKKHAEFIIAGNERKATSLTGSELRKIYYYEIDKPCQTILGNIIEEFESKLIELYLTYEKTPFKEENNNPFNVELQAPIESEVIKCTDFIEFKSHTANYIYFYVQSVTPEQLDFVKVNFNNCKLFFNEYKKLIFKVNFLFNRNH